MVNKNLKSFFFKKILCIVRVRIFFCALGLNFIKKLSLKKKVILA